MRYQRNVKIFRGQFEFAPFAGLFSLLFLFLVLSALTYSPGVRISLGDAPVPAKTSSTLLTVNKQGEITLNNQLFNLSQMEQLRLELKKLPPNSIILLNADPAAPREVLSLVREKVRGVNLNFESAGNPIVLANIDSATLPETPGVRLVVNLAGQMFFENQMINSEKLILRLQELLKQSPFLTLVVEADELTENKVTMEVLSCAKKAGVKNVLLGGRVPTATLINPKH
ncbi:MAG: Biopolymer transport protein ExbD/TolR [Verrucomicrobiales bacterium]|nr:Biopolymer transport protein ExbD/TolR [Verrucomicrobiales bacterium]